MFIYCSDEETVELFRSKGFKEIKNPNNDQIKMFLMDDDLMGEMKSFDKENFIISKQLNF